MTDSVRVLSRDEVLGFNSRWTDEDREIVEREIDRLGGLLDRFLVPPRGGSIRMVDGSGDTIGYIGKGFFGWKQSAFDGLSQKPVGTVRDDRDDSTRIELSTWKGRGERAGRSSPSSMDLREYLSAIAAGYSRSSLASPGHLLLKDAASQLMPLLPAGLTVEGSGGKGNATLTPWIGILDPDETDSPQSGIYVVYIFTTDLKRVVLTLNQGVYKLREEHGDRKARILLAKDADRVRAGMDGAKIVGTVPSVSFGSGRGLQRAYEAGNICAIEYEIATLPTAAELEADLSKLVDLYQEAIAVKRHLLQSEPGTISSASVQQGEASSLDPLREFAPMSDSEYVAHLVGRRLVKSRRHETLVKQFGEHATGLGLAPATNVHPRDLTLVVDNEDWLVEAKVVYNGNTTHAVREAIGQLFQYRHFLYQGHSVKLLALFTEEVGAAHVELLESLGIGAVWKCSGGWEGSSSAVAAGLIQ